MSSIPPHDPMKLPDRFRGFCTSIARDVGFGTFDLGEAPNWNSETQSLSWVDINNGTLHTRHLPTGGTDTVGFVNTLACFSRRDCGGFICGNHDRLSLVDPDGAAAIELTSVEAELPHTRINDGKCDRQGRFWIGTMGLDGSSESGGLYRVEPNGDATKILGGIGTANGLDWSPDDAVFYFTDSRRQAIYTFEFSCDAGTITNQKEFVKLWPKEGRPDGLIVDSEGYVWSAIWDGWCVIRFDPRGEIDRVIGVPVPRPTSVALGGEDMKTLFITSARAGLTDTQLQSAPLSGSIFGIEVKVPGLAQSCFAA